MVNKEETTSKTEKPTKVEKPINLDAILNKARAQFSKNEKSLSLQISTGASIHKPDKDSDFICWRGSHWEALTGIRGLPFGRITQIAGRPDSGKSSHACQFMSLAQAAGHIVILWDSENKFSATRFDKYFGGHSDQLLTVTSKMILEGGTMVEFLIKSTMEMYPNKKILVVWDSVGGTLSKSEGVKDLKDTMQMAEASKENGRVIRGLVRLMEEYKDKQTGEEKIAVLLINQSYAQINSPGQKESGGQKVEFFSSLILQLTRKADLNKTKDNVKYRIGIVTRAKVKKNHMFDGDSSVAELDLQVTAGGIQLHVAKEKDKDAETVEDEE